jgi:hypothetical protein
MKHMCFIAAPNSAYAFLGVWVPFEGFRVALMIPARSWMEGSYMRSLLPEPNKHPGRFGSEMIITGPNV